MQDASPIKAGLTLLTIFVGNLCHFIDSFAHIVYTNLKKKKFCPIKSPQTFWFNPRIVLVSVAVSWQIMTLPHLVCCFHNN